MSIRKKVVWLPYDMDTAIGINNEGQLVFGYNLEDIDHIEGGADVFNGQESVLWKNIRAAFSSELAAMYRQLRSTGALSYAKVEKMFEDHQDKWPEAIFNEDSWFKYIEPLTKDGNGSYLPMMQGSKAEQRKWWLYNRFRYIDSKYNAGDALSDLIQIRGYAKADVTVTPYADIYPSVKYGSYLVQTRGARNTPATLLCPLDNVNDTEIYIYSASQLASVGDLSGFKVGFADFSMATKLQSIKVGDSDANYDNQNLTALTLGNNVLLKTLDVRNCSGLGTGDQKTVDISGCEIIENVYFDGTAIAGVTLPNGGVLKVLHLPATITNLSILNQKAITDLTVASYANISTLRLENVPTLDTKAILRSVGAGTRVRLIGIAWEAQNATEIAGLLDLLDTMRGLDESGNNVETAQVSGTIHTTSLTGEQIASYNSRYPYIRVTADYVESTLTCLSYDNTTVLATITCLNGVPQTAVPSAPSKPDSADGHYSYTAVGWNTHADQETNDPAATTNVIADRTIYPAYSKTVKTYTVTWKSGTSTVRTDSNVAWGTTPTWGQAMPTKDGQTATGWDRDLSQPITGNTTINAVYTPIYNVYFYNGSTLLDTVQVLRGGSASYTGATPQKTGVSDPSLYQFTGWSPSPTNVQGNLSVYAQFEQLAAAWETPGFDASGAYAVQWHYGLTMPDLSRGGLAASFSDPSPATSLAGNGSSPFDNILPWSGMKRYCVISGQLIPDTDPAFDAENYDTVVYIPEFYYKSEKDTTKQMWTWAVSPTPITGYAKHPGSGLYVGRYHTGGSSSGVYSKSGVNPLANTSQTNFRTYSAAKGTGWRMLDLAAWSAIQMLYLVEFANFDSQTMLGMGYNVGSVGAMGGTDDAAYHTLKASGAHNQYRWIEDPFSNVREWIDGFIGSKNSNCFAAASNSYTGTTTGLNDLGFRLPASSDISGFGYSEYAPWAFIPDASTNDANYATYVCDQVSSNTSAYPASVGGYCYAYASYGMFYFSAGSAASYTGANIGSRLLYKP